MQGTAWKQGAVSAVEQGLVSIICLWDVSKFECEFVFGHGSAFSSLCPHTVDGLFFYLHECHLGCLGSEKLFSKWSFPNRDQAACVSAEGRKVSPKPRGQSRCCTQWQDEEEFCPSSCFLVQHLFECFQMLVLISVATCAFYFSSVF